MGTELFIAVGVFPVELLACQVSMVCGANRPFAAKPSRDLLFIKLWAIT